MGQSKIFEGADLLALLNEDSTRVLKQLTEALNVAQLTISEHLHTLRKIQNEEKWFP